MGAHCIRHTELPHTSRLFADYLYDFDRVAEFYDHAPLHPDSLARAAGQIDYPEERRAALVSALGHLNQGSPLLERLAKPGTVAVITGQQVGLLSGHCYTIYKALSAVRLAERLTAQGIPAVPIFWLATEDHDLAEINHAWLFDAKQHPFQVTAAGENSAQMPVGGLVVGDLPLDEMRERFHELPFGDDVVALVEAAYQPGRSYGEAFRHLVKALLGPYELLVADPLDPALREIAAPFLSRAVRESGELKKKLLERNAKLAEAGYHAQVHVEDDTSLFFLLRGGRRLTLREKNGEFVAREGRFTAEQLAADGAQLSPNALLRPVTQDWIFPTIAYIGGPAELAYMAQSQPLYHALLGRMPVMLPRAGFTLLDARAVKLMDRYGLTLQQVFPCEERLRDRIAHTLMPETLTATYDDVRTQVVQQLGRLEAELSAFDPTLLAALTKSRDKIVYQLQKNERKIARESIRRNERAGADATYLFEQIYPNRHLQERFYSILPFLARHGVDLVSRVYENVHSDCPDHILLSV